MPAIQWYPGHIAKLERQLTDLLKQVDVVVEVVDARMPTATLNPRLRRKYHGPGSSNKPLLVLLNKSDLGDPVQNKRWLQHFRAEGSQGQPVEALLYDSNSGKEKKRLVDAMVKLGEQKMKALMAKGLKRRPVRVVIVGMPNVGKSSVINSIVGRKKAQTGHKAGVTRQPQWVRIHSAVELLDTPGVIPPSLDSDEVGMLLATVSSVGEAAYDEEQAAPFLIERIERYYPGLLARHYKLPEEETLELYNIAQARHYVSTGGTVDVLRAAQAVLSEFRQGRIGRLTLEQLSRAGTEAAADSLEDADEESVREPLNDSESTHHQSQETPDASSSPDEA